MRSRIDGRWGVRVAVLLAPCLLAGCGRSSDRAAAARGVIDRQAPVRTSVAITIGADRATVWAVLSDIARWPNWQPEIQATRITGPAGPGVPFRWTTDGGTIRSRIALFEPGKRLAWTGRLLVFRAIHVWTLAALPNGGTEVTTDESLRGWPIGWFFSSAELEQSDRRWLGALKRAAEQRARSAPPTSSVFPGHPA